MAVNLPIILMALAAGVSLDAAFAHGFVGLRRRPVDAVRIAFAIQALIVMAGALAIIAMYSAETAETHFLVMKWVFFPASLAWIAATMWLVAFYTGVRPLRLLLALSGGFAALILVNLLLPYGTLHRVVGSIATTHMAGGDVSVMVAPTPHPVYYLGAFLSIAAFLFMFAAAWRLQQHGEALKARVVTAFLLLFLVAAVLDSLQDFGIIRDLYYTQLSFVVLVMAINVGLRQESLSHEAGLVATSVHLESLVRERVKDLDEANTRLALESQQRLAAAEALRRRVAELDALHRISRTLADRVDLVTALDQASAEIAQLLSAEQARVELDPAVSEAPAGAGRSMVVPLAAGERALDALRVVRDHGEPFSEDERRLAETVAGDVAAAVENERLHERQTRLAAEEERQRLAHDLHDAVTQTLYSATLITGALPQVWERDPAEGLAGLERLQRLVRGALAEMRTLLFELRPAALEATPLDALLERLGEATAAQVEGPVTVRADDVALTPEAKLAFYRVTQQALNNIIKHARATEVDVECTSLDGGTIRLCVRDDGVGFEPADVGPESMGLRIMRERLEKVGASFELVSARGRGTSITAVWQDPLPTPAPQERRDRDRSTTH